MKYLLLLTLVSCSQVPLRERMFKVDSKIIGYKCPNDHYLSVNFECLPVNEEVVVKKIAKPIKKTAKKVDCKKIFREINQCMK